MPAPQLRCPRAKRSFAHTCVPKRSLGTRRKKHSDGIVAYPLGLARGAVLGQGDSYEEALADVRSAVAFHLETFGPGALGKTGALAGHPGRP